MIRTDPKLARLQRMADVQAAAARRALAPVLARRRGLRARVLDLRGTLAIGHGPTPAELAELSATEAHRHWCRSEIASTQLALARLEVELDPLQQALARAEARIQVLAELQDRVHRDADRTARRRLEEAPVADRTDRRAGFS